MLLSEHARITLANRLQAVVYFFHITAICKPYLGFKMFKIMMLLLMCVCVAKIPKTNAKKITSRNHWSLGCIIYCLCLISRTETINSSKAPCVNYRGYHLNSLTEIGLQSTLSIIDQYNKLTVACHNTFGRAKGDMASCYQQSTQNLSTSIRRAT